MADVPLGLHTYVGAEAPVPKLGWFLVSPAAQGPIALRMPPGVRARGFYGGGSVGRMTGAHVLCPAGPLVISPPPHRVAVPRSCASPWTC